MQYGFTEKKSQPLLRNHLHLGGTNKIVDIQVTNRYLEKNGKPWIPIMGEFQYCRVPRRDWERELAKMKAGGITIVSTYVIWIYHEEKEGVFDFSGNKDIGEFVRVCSELGFYVLLRIGPWIHGEVRNGGFPDWLLKKGIPVRCCNREFMNYVQIYYNKIYEQTKEQLFDRNGCVIGIQLDNEVQNDAAYLLALKQLAEKIGFHLPLYTVTGWGVGEGARIPEKEVLPVFGGYPEAVWEPHTRPLLPSSHYFFLEERNDAGIGDDLRSNLIPEKENYRFKKEWYPFATCELGGGMETSWLRRPIISGDDISAIALVKLGCGNNLPGYYMYHGGTNGDGNGITLQESAESGYPNDYPVKSYDFQAVIGEEGQIRSHYSTLRLLHYFIQDRQESLAAMETFFQAVPVNGRKDRRNLRYSLRTNGTSGFVFVNNHQHTNDLEEHHGVQFKVPAENTDSGTMIFPEEGMTIHRGSYFILPFFLDLGNLRLTYATVQLICHQENSWFFFLPQEGKAGEYVLEKETVFLEHNRRKTAKRIPIPKEGSRISVWNGINWIHLTTFTRKEAEHFYQMNGNIYLTSGDMYQMKNRLICYQKSDNHIVIKKWNGTDFTGEEYTKDKMEIQPAWRKLGSFQMKKEDLGNRIYLKEHFLGNQNVKTLQYYEIFLEEDNIKGLEDAYLEINYQGDVIQLYNEEGILLADDFYKGTSWELSIRRLLDDKEHGKFYFLVSDLTEEIYLERGKRGCGEISEIFYIPVYSQII